MATNDFYIFEKKFEKYFDMAQDWFLRSKGLKEGSEDKKIALLFQKKYNRVAMEYLAKANKELENDKN